jgi:N utilization substance protein B
VKGTRRQAREAALQVLYFCEVGRATPDEALATYFAEHLPEADPAVRTFAADLVRGTTADLPALDELIGRHAEHWRVDRLAILDRIVLRMAVWELQHVADTPPAVVLNEAIELARAFGTDESPRFVNGVLDSIRRGLGREV